jgi:hypothetical protein
MKRIYLNFLFLLLATSCIKHDVQPGDLLSPMTFSTKQVQADGTSLITVSTVINANSDSTKRTVVFTTKYGSWVGGKDSTISKKATYINQQLVASVQYKAPSSVVGQGMDTINAKMYLPAEKQDYSQTDYIKVTASTPTKLVVSASAFSVKVNFGSEITVTGTLTNSQGNPVSLGSVVVFENRFDDQTAVNGRFRQQQLSSNAQSTVSAIYSPGNVATGRNIWLSCFLLDSSGNKTAIKDSVLITTN